MSNTTRVVQPYSMPPWRGAPAGGLGVTVALDAVIAESDVAVVRVTHLQVHREGMTLALERLVDPHLDRLPDVSGRRGSPLCDDPRGFVFGLRYSDGREGNSDVTQQPPTTVWPPDDQVLIGGGSGSGLPNRSSTRFWVWPLPPPGPVWIWCEWPATGLDRSESELDGDPIQRAARQAIEKWPQDDLPRLGGI